MGKHIFGTLRTQKDGQDNALEPRNFAMGESYAFHDGGRVVIYGTKMARDEAVATDCAFLDPSFYSLKTIGWCAWEHVSADLTSQFSLCSVMTGQAFDLQPNDCLTIFETRIARDAYVAKILEIQEAMKNNEQETVGA